MNITQNSIRTGIIALIISTFIPVSVVTTTAKASFVGSRMAEDGGDTLTEREIDEIKIKRALENKVVQSKLAGSGMSPEEVRKKLDRMTDEEVQQIASLSEKVPAGGNAAGFIVGVLLITVLVLVILYLAKRI